MEVKIPRILISSGYSGVGKSTFGIGLAVALRKRNLSIAFGVKGPNLLQANAYHRLSRRYTRSFDKQIYGNDQMLETLRQAATGADLVIIEGEAGLFDGTRPGSLEGSDAEFAIHTGTPVVLLLNPGEYEASFSAVVRGFLDLAPSLQIGGIIANRLQSVSTQAMAKGRSFYDAALQGFNMSSLLGALPESKALAPISRGRDAFREDGQAVFPRQFFVSMGSLVESHVDLERLLEIAHTAAPIEMDTEGIIPMMRRCRIGVADDSCFGLCFQDNLDLLRLFGAKLVSFSPLADLRLPGGLGGLYIPGGNIGEYAAELSANQDMKDSIRDFISQGGVVYSEGAGTAYLCQQFATGANSERYVSGVGAIPAIAQAYDPFLNYTESVMAEDCILGVRGSVVNGISANNWMLDGDISLYKVMNLSYAGEKPILEGFSPNAQVIGTFCFNNFASNPFIAKNLVDACSVVCGITE
ncbi:MAG: hypothetical protein GYA55_01695 [SAR324 cluster bacterium]|uniref:CobB/CobQ-like glutamine amidotransferase domain-containing protein n=1 Tax=SAR324 cluster bacterium TaxID=2024889 RepID=A0A7X9FPH6_9DELT|nr:hypothetical protein [SAR324 cluster bacterium]